MKAKDRQTDLLHPITRSAEPHSACPSNARVCHGRKVGAKRSLCDRHTCHFLPRSKPTSVVHGVEKRKNVKSGVRVLMVRT